MTFFNADVSVAMRIIPSAKHPAMSTYTPSPQLLKDVRAALVIRGTSFKAFCASQGFVRQAVAAALTGRRNGPKSVALGERFLAKVADAE